MRCSLPPIETPIRTPSQARFRSREERIEIGKSLRERLPRSGHAIWQPPAAGREPIEIIEASPAFLTKSAITNPRSLTESQF
jgi:hypothetical protein